MKLTDGMLTAEQLSQLDLIEIELIDMRSVLENIHIDINGKILDSKEDPLSNFVYRAWTSTDDAIRRIKAIQKF